MYRSAAKAVNVSIEPRVLERVLTCDSRAHANYHGPEVQKMLARKYFGFPGSSQGKIADGSFKCHDRESKKDLCCVRRAGEG
jgi:hypothetical protein